MSGHRLRRMVRGVHLQTALVVSAVWSTVLLLWFLRRRQRTRGMVTEADRATYETLHTASLAAVEFRDGLTEHGSERAGRHLRTVLGSSAVAVCDRIGVLAWEGAGADHHVRQARAHADTCLESGRTVVLGQRDLTCPEPDCPVRAAVVSPLLTGDVVVGTLTAYGPQISPGLVRATEELAGWVSAQLDVAEAGRERTRAMEAELRALRAQISPHFVYNSLAAIASFVRTDPERARELLLEFADFTRYALRRGGAFTTLADELRNVERYLVLEQARFGERLGVSLLIAPEVLPISLPYLAIQPLVENAVRHGLAAKVGPGHVTITARDRGSEAEIVVEDDGVGAVPEVIQRALDNAPGGDDPSASVGLGNVDARLRQVYGDDHGLVVETAPGEGMRVSFRVPKYSPNVHASP